MTFVMIWCYKDELNWIKNYLFASFVKGITFNESLLDFVRLFALSMDFCLQSENLKTY